MHGCRRRPRTLYNIGRSTRSFAARSAGSVGVQKRAHRDLPATSKRKKSCIKARNCLQTTDISCIVAVETAGCTFCGENFRICHPMNSSRSMLLQASAQEKGKTTRPELCAQDRSEAAKAVWVKASHCGFIREKAGNGRGNKEFVSRVQVRRTAVCAAFAAERMNAWDELCL